jgi:hypothetical protein
MQVPSQSYGITAARARSSVSSRDALAAADALGCPVVLKTGEPGIEHKSDARGVLLGIPDPAGWWRCPPAGWPPGRVTRRAARSGTAGPSRGAGRAGRRGPGRGR